MKNRQADPAFAAWLRDERSAKGLTQQDLADLLGVTRQTVIEWEAARSTPYRSNRTAAEKKLREYGQTGRKDHTSDNPVPDEGWTPNPRFREAMPPRAYAVVTGYMDRLRRAGLGAGELDRMERLFFEGRYAQRFSASDDARSEADAIELADATWDVIREVLAVSGVRP